MEENGARAQLFCTVARFMEMLPELGVRFHTKESKRWWPRQSVPLLDFRVDAKTMRVRIPEGLGSSTRMVKLKSGLPASAREAS